MCFFMSPGNLPGGVEVAQVALNVVGGISAIFAINHALETDIKYFLIFFFSFPYYKADK